MNGEIRILHLEDDPADAELVHATLKGGGIACRITRVDGRSEFESALRQNSYDLIFADYLLPTYDGVTALALTRQVCPDTPFIMISGTLGEDAAIECLTRGATDYVTKQKLMRLVPVVTRALSEAENSRRRKKAEKEIALMSFALNNVRESAFLIDKNARFQFVNEEACSSLGYSRSELLDLRVPDVDLDFPLDRWYVHWTELKAQRTIIFEGRHRKKDGQVLTVEVSANYFEYEGQSYDLALVRDITERKRAEEALQRLSHVVEQSPVSVIVTDTEGCIEYVNPKFTHVTGYARSDVIGKNPRILKSGVMPSGVYVDLWKALTTGRDWRGELCNRRMDGSLYWELAIISPMVDASGRITHYIAVKEDISARKAMEDDIKASLREKEILLREVHHRVKNNLQIISSLHSLQAEKYSDETMREAFRESQRRVRTMALVHEQLYRSENFAGIDFGGFLALITRELMTAYGRAGIALDIDVCRVEFPVDLAIPCGLMFNELMTNALKHAFPGGRNGTVTVRLQQGESDHARLLVGDDGVGFPPQFVLSKRSGLGMNLVFTLLEQASATMALDTSNGTRFTLDIPVP